MNGDVMKLVYSVTVVPMCYRLEESEVAYSKTERVVRVVDNAIYGQ